MNVKTLVGKKIGMTQVFQPDGNALPCTAIQVGPCQVVQIKKQEKDGYNALQVGFDSKREKTFTKPELGHFKKHNAKPSRLVKEIEWDGQGEIKEGDKLTVEQFENVQFVNITGITKGRGFAGVVKRYDFAGGPATHGQTDRERAAGSLGRQGSVTRDVIKGKKMAGHYGNETVTIRNLQVVKVIKDKNILLVKGGIPGANGNYVMVNASKKVRGQAPTSKKQKIEIKKK